MARSDHQHHGGRVADPNRRTSAGPRVYFDVDDINAAGARVNELGGEAAEAMPVPGMGWFFICTDTEGNEFGSGRPIQMPRTQPVGTTRRAATS